MSTRVRIKTVEIMFTMLYYLLAVANMVANILILYLTPMYVTSNSISTMIMINNDNDAKSFLENSVCHFCTCECL